MSQLPDPLVSPDVDLRDFPYMPLDVARLRDSDLAALVSAESFRAAVILWCAAWHQVPGASLPSDDQALARLAGYGRDLAGWREAKDGALRGFVLCADERLYHPVIAQKAISAWEAKVAQRARTAAATAARLAKHQSADEKRHETRDEPRHVGRDEQRNERHDVVVTSSKGKGEGKRDSISSLRSDNAREARAVFDRDFWPRYPNKAGKPIALRAFEKLFREMRGSINPILEGLQRYIANKPPDRPWLNPATFLNQRRFEDQPAPASVPPNLPSEPRVDFGGGVSAPHATVRSLWRRGEWLAQWGPTPEHPDCRVSPDIMTAIMSEAV